MDDSVEFVPIKIGMFPFPTPGNPIVVFELLQLYVAPGVFPEILISLLAIPLQMDKSVTG